MCKSYQITINSVQEARGCLQMFHTIKVEQICRFNVMITKFISLELVLLYLGFLVECGTI
jgi:hypothetical protein